MAQKAEFRSSTNRSVVRVPLPRPWLFSVLQQLHNDFLCGGEAERILLCLAQANRLWRNLWW
jgi:hypothetical protein